MGIRAFVNLTGKKFNRLTVLGISLKRGKNNQIHWDCLCDCGKLKSIMTTSLKRGLTKSCGCILKEAKTTHGLSKKGQRVKGYNTWDMMKQRCTNPNHDSFCDYGARGITICDRWLDNKNGFSNFIIDMGERPSLRHSLDRYPDINGNYCPENCRWGTDEQQSRGKRNNVWIEYNGERKIQKDWAKLLNISYNYLRTLCKYKSFEDIVSFCKTRVIRNRYKK